MNSRDFKALLDELKKINDNLSCLWKTIYISQNKHLPGDKHVKVDDLAPLYKAFKIAEAGLAGESEKKLLKGVRGILVEIQNNAMRD